MPEKITPSSTTTAVKQGFLRMKQYRAARLMFVREFCGQYYRNSSGLTGDEPINLIFHTIRAMVPNLVMQNPVNRISTPYIQQQEYAELLGLGVNQVEQATKLKDTLRAWVVSALFGWGITKTGLAASGETLQFGDIDVDPGQIYVELVDLDDFVFDPMCTDITKAVFLGSKIHTPRQILLDTDGYNHDLIKKLPRSKFGDRKKVEELSKINSPQSAMHDMQDVVDVVELWVPEANSLVTIPDPEQITFNDDYLRLTDYYGPKEGPYTLLSFTPPVPNNPLPISSVSLWYDIHKMANRMFSKNMLQTDRQKDILVFNPAQADEAQDINEASDGDSVASIDPNGVKVVSFGGQNPGNSAMLQELQVWYNYIAGNPDQMAGNLSRGTGGKETATRSQILQNNASIGIEDARGILYDRTAEIGRKIAWYLHTDPLINLPMTKRKTGGEQIQLWLTPEQRVGDFLDFTFDITARSMSRLDPAIKSKRLQEFGINVIPSVINAGMVALQMGQQLNVQQILTDMAKELGILDEIQDWFHDPEFQQKMAIQQSLGPQNLGKASTAGPGSTEQNGGSPVTRKVMSPTQESNSNAQRTSADSQSASYGSY